MVTGRVEMKEKEEGGGLTTSVKSCQVNKRTCGCVVELLGHNTRHPLLPLCSMSILIPHRPATIVREGQHHGFHKASPDMNRGGGGRLF